MAEQIEATVDALVARLKANLPAKIDAVNATITDEYTLEYPTEVAIAAKAEPAYPFIIVAPDSTTTSLDTGGRMFFDHRIRVTSWVSGWSEEGLARSLMRYQRAVRETILKERDADSGGYGLQHLDDEYGPIFSPENAGYFYQAAQSLFAVQQEQAV